MFRKGEYYWLNYCFRCDLCMFWRFLIFGIGYFIFISFIRDIGDFGYKGDIRDILDIGKFCNVFDIRDVKYFGIIMNVGYFKNF